MLVSRAADVTKKLTELQLMFKQQLAGKISDITYLWEAIDKEARQCPKLIDLHRMVQGLAGSGGTFGAVAVSNVARELEQILKSQFTESDQVRPILIIKRQKIAECIKQLKQVADDWQPSTISYIQFNSIIQPHDGNLIYLLEEDDVLATELIANLGHADYQVRHFVEIKDVEAAFQKEFPAAIIMDVDFGHAAVTAAQVVTRLSDTLDTGPPLIFISGRDDMEVRLAAARVGASRFFCKPLDMTKLTQALDSLTTQSATKPFRVLLIDDDEILLEYYAIVLRAAGMDVEILSNPLQSLKVLAEFRPDVIVMDVYMPECSGPELAQVIRQDDTWALTPILYLSTESNLNSQLAAINLGGDDFLSKPIEASYLVSAVLARAKRARSSNRLNKNLKSALRESEFLLATMDQHDIVSTTDVTGRITSVNDRFCEISGYGREQLTGQNHRMLRSSYHPSSFYKDLWHTISHGRIWRGTICNRRQDGSEYWVESTIVPFLNDNGKPYKYVSARTDITALRQSEERLHRSQVFANIGTWDWDITTSELYWSDRIGPLFGYQEKVPETTYKNFIAAVHPDDRRMVIDAVNNCVERGAEYNIEHRVLFPDGSVRWLQESGDVVRGERGEPLHMLGVVQDITERKTSEVDLLRHRAAMESSIDGIAILDAMGEFVYLNPAYLAIYDYQSAAELLGKSWECLYSQVEIKIFAEDIVPKLGAKGQWSGNLVGKKKDGRTFPQSLSMSMLPGGGTVFIVRDITEIKRVEQELLTAKEEAENANRAKSQFLSSMSHELRTPMNAIIGFSQLLKMDAQEPLSESQKENVDEITKAGHHLLQLINEVLDLAKIETGRIDLSLEIISLGQVVIESIQLITPLAQKRGIEVSLMSDGVDVSIEQLYRKNNTVRVDRTRFKQVLLNLLSNAVKYNCENGKLIIACNDMENNHTRISITDTGAGLTQEQQTHLFTAFDRLGAEHSEVEGTGIGLVITKYIIELMAGRIGVDSQPGVGSTFWIELPSENVRSIERIRANKKTTPDQQVITALKNMHTVLYIEDNPANLRLVAQLLGRRPNIHMWSAHEPLLGLELAEEHKPDLILLDINLPGMDGFEVFKQLRKRQATQKTPVIAISANAMLKDIEMGLEAGFDNYITKPIDVIALLKAVDTTLSATHQ